MPAFKDVIQSQNRMPPYSYPSFPRKREPRDFSRLPLGPRVRGDDEFAGSEDIRTPSTAGVPRVHQRFKNRYAAPLGRIRRCRTLTDRVVEVTPTLDGFDVAVHRVEVRAHRHDRDVAPPSLAPRRNIAGPLVVAATVLLDRLEAEGIGIPSEFAQLGDDPRLDLDRFGLSPARKQEPVPDPGRPVVSGLAETSQPNRDLPFRARQDPGSVDPVIGVFMVDHRLFPQLADQANLLLLPLAAAAKMSGHLETVEFHPIPADPDDSPRRGRHPPPAWRRAQ